MIKDITIGQFFPGESFLHRLDPRMKIVLVFLMLVILFLVKHLIMMAGMIVFVFLMLLLSKIPFKVFLKSLKPLIPILILTTVLNMFFIDGEILFQFWVIKITEEGVETAIFMVARIICLILISSLLTYTTSPTVLTDAIERLFSPLKKVKIDVHVIAMMMTIALRFIPILIEEVDKIMSAQKARGADLESGNLIQRGKAMIPILIPLFVSSFRRADELAFAMECKCYNGGEGRTRMKQMKLAFRDYMALFFTVFLCGGVVFLNQWIVTG